MELWQMDVMGGVLLQDGTEQRKIRPCRERSGIDASLARGDGMSEVAPTIV